MARKSDPGTWILAGGRALQFPPLQFIVERADTRAGRRQAGWVATAEWGGKQRRFAAAYVPVGTPRNVARAIEQARSSAREDGSVLPLIVAPFLGSDALSALERAEVSGIDLSGNGVVIVPGEWLIWRTGQKNQFPASTPIQEIYRGTSSLVGRVFLSRPEYPRFGAIQEEIQARGGSISASTVSKVLRVLEEDLIVERTDAGIIRLLNPERLLDQLVAARTFKPVRSIRGTFTDPEDGPAKFRERAEAAGVRLMVRDERRYVSAPVGDEVVAYYTTSVAGALTGTSFEAEPRYGENQIIEIDRPEVFFDAREERGVLYASPLQIYLELANGGKREQEIAEPLRADLLAFRFS